jgi:hypothetical protein
LNFQESHPRVCFDLSIQIRRNEYFALRINDASLDFTVSVTALGRGDLDLCARASCFFLETRHSLPANFHALVFESGFGFD